MKYIRYAAVLLTCIILGAVVAVPHSVTLDCVTSAVYSSNGSVCCIDEDNDRYSIYNINSDNEYTSAIYTNKIEKDGSYNFYSRLFTDNENVYINGYTDNSSSKTSEQSETCYKVYLCEFDKKKLTEKWSFTPQTDVFDTFIRDGRFYYIEYQRSDTGVFKIYNVEGDRSILVSTYQMKVPYICEEIFYNKENRIFFRTNAGNIYSLTDEFEETGESVVKKIYPSEKTDFSQADTLRFSDNGVDKIYAVDTQSRNFICIDTISGKSESRIQLTRALTEIGKDLSDIRWISCTDDTNFISSIEINEDKFQICCCHEDTINVISRITKESSLSFTILYSLAMSLFFALLGLFVMIAIYIMKHNYISIILRILFLILPFTLVSYYFFENKIEKYIELTFNQYQYENMSYIINNRVKYLTLYEFDNKSLLEFDWDRYVGGNIKDTELYEEYVDSIKKAELFSDDDRKTSKYRISLYITDPDNKTDMILFMNSGMSMNVPIDYTLNHTMAEKIKETSLTGKEYIYKKYDYDGLKYNCISLPVFSNNDKDIVGVAEISICSNDVMIKTHEIVAFINNMVYSAVIFLFSVVTVMILACVFPLKSLKRCAEKSVAVETAVEAEVFGKNDVSMLSVAYNNTVTELNRMIRKIKDVNICYKHYVPQGAVKLLNKISASDIKPETENSQRLTVLYISFGENVKNMKNNSFREMINSVLCQSDSEINKRGGFINHCSKDYIDIYFNNAAGALQTAVFINQLTEKNNISPVAVVHTAEMKIRIIGNQENYRFCFMYENMKEIKKIIMSADDFNSRIIVSQSTEKEIGNYNNIFSSRLLGVIRMSNQKEKIYDVFDSDPGYEKNKKRITQTAFENGVNSLINKNYYDARKAFLDVLRIYPEDMAAKKYFYISDKKLTSAQN